MRNPRLHKQLDDIAQELVTLRVQQALANARQAGPEHFGETLLANLPPGPSPELVWFDIDAITGEEWGSLLDADMRAAIDTLPLDALRRVARGELLEALRDDGDEVLEEEES